MSETDNTDFKPLKMDGFDECIIGMVEVQGRGLLLAYARRAILNVLIERDGMSEEEAVEYFDFNIAGAWVGPGTPVIVDMMLPEDALAMLDEEGDE